MVTLFLLLKLYRVFSLSLWFVFMYVGVVELLRNLPHFMGEVRLAVNTRYREPALRSYPAVDRVGPSERDFASQSEIIAL